MALLASLPAEIAPQTLVMLLWCGGGSLACHPAASHVVHLRVSMSSALCHATPFPVVLQYCRSSSHLTQHHS